MKFRVTFKTPDAVEYAITGQLIRAIPSEASLEEFTTEDVYEARQDLCAKLQSVTDKYVSYGESITIEFDSETDSATVVEKGK